MFIKNNNKQWIEGLTYTKGYHTFTTNPDDSVGIIYVHGGLFFWKRFYLSDKKYIEVYAGFRPTPPWSVGYGNEGDGIFTKSGQWLKKKGWGNLGFAIRLKTIR